MAIQFSKDRPIESKIKDELDKAGISGRALAVKLGTSTAYVARRLSGEVEMSVSDVERIAEVLSVPVGAFFGEVAA